MNWRLILGGLFVGLVCGTGVAVAIIVGRAFMLWDWWPAAGASSTEFFEVVRALAFIIFVVTAIATWIDDD